MAKHRTHKMTPITPADLDRFHRNAPAALARRGRGYITESVLNGAQTILVGGVPIVGLLYWGWSGMDMLLFLIVTMLNTFGLSAGVRLIATGVIIVTVIAIGGGRKTA